MPVVELTPTRDHIPPFDLGDEIPPTFAEQLQVAGNTAELQVSLGAPLETTPENAEEEKDLLIKALRAKKTSNLTINTAFAAAAFLRTYGQSIALDVVTARAAITNKLLELANCGDPKYELKALELLGKHSDIGIFTERSEVTINYKNPEDLETAIKERVKRLLNATMVDITPLGMNLDEELGVVNLQNAKDEQVEISTGKETVKNEIENDGRLLANTQPPENTPP